MEETKTKDIRLVDANRALMDKIRTRRNQDESKPIEYMARKTFGGLSPGDASRLHRQLRSSAFGRKILRRIWAHALLMRAHPHADFQDANLSQIENVQAVLDHANLRSANLSDTVWIGGLWRSPDLTRALFRRSAMISVALEKAALQSTVLEACDLHCVTLSHAILDYIAARDTVWSFSTFTNTWITNTSFSGATFSDMALEQCTLHNVSFGGATFCGETSLKSTTLRNVDLSAADLRGFQAQNCTYDAQCRFPEGFAPEESGFALL